MSFSSFPCRKLLFGSQAVQRCQGSDPFCFQAALAWIRLMMSSCWALCRFAVFACWLWWTGLFLSIVHCNLCWLCWWTRCWMLQNTDHMQAGWVFYVDVGTCNRFEQNKMCITTVIAFGITMLTVHHDMLFGVCCIQNPSDFLRRTSSDFLSVKGFTVYMSQRGDCAGRSPRFIPLNKHPTSDRLGANRRVGGTPCRGQLCATGFILCRTSKLAVTHAILTWSWLYIPQDFPLLFVIFFLRTSHFVPLSSSLHFHCSISWLHKHRSRVRVEANRAERRPFHPIRHPLWLNYNADTT